MDESSSLSESYDYLFKLLLIGGAWLCYVKDQESFDNVKPSFSQEKLNPSFVVEIYIHPWDPLDARNRKLFKVFHINDIMHKKESAPDCFKKARVNFCLRSHI